MCWSAWICAPQTNRDAALKIPKPSRSAKAPARRPAGKYFLRLYVAGATVRSRQAVGRVHQVCQAELGDNYVLEVIDIYQEPAMARAHQIVATPTLVKEFPRPVRRFIGNLAQTTGLFGEAGLASTSP